MKQKILVIFAIILASFASFYIYEQNKLLQAYRTLLYGQLAVVQHPVEQILQFQQQAENYDETTRGLVFETLQQSYADVFNHTGGGLQLEPHIREQYFHEYNDFKLAVVYLLKDYEQASSAQERLQAHESLQQHYDSYQQFLQRACVDLCEVFE